MTAGIFCDFAVAETRVRRERALAALQQIADDGGFDFDKLDELDLG